MSIYRKKLAFIITAANITAFQGFGVEEKNDCKKRLHDQIQDELEPSSKRRCIDEPHQSNDEKIRQLVQKNFFLNLDQEETIYFITENVDLFNHMKQHQDLYTSFRKTITDYYDDLFLKLSNQIHDAIEADEPIQHFGEYIKALRIYLKTMTETINIDDMLISSSTSQFSTDQHKKVTDYISFDRIAQILNSEYYYKAKNQILVERQIYIDTLLSWFKEEKWELTKKIKPGELREETDIINSAIHQGDQVESIGLVQRDHYYKMLSGLLKKIKPVNDPLNTICGYISKDNKRKKALTQNGWVKEDSPDSNLVFQ
jgi:hypothetical protein